jgi:uncharacterized protein YjbJ (UPF0337 family)
MSDVSSAGRVPDPTYPVDVPVTSAYPTGPTYADYADPAPAAADTSTAKQVAGQAKEATGQAATEVKDTAQEQVQRVAHEAKAQARNVVGDVRDKVGEQARSQNDKLVGSIRQTADHLDEMRGDRVDGPAAQVVSRVADGGRQLADYLDRNGPEGVLREVQDFARRRPGAFLATALAAGFVVGRLGKSVAKADSAAGVDKPVSDSFSSTGNTTGTEYVAPVTWPATTGTTEYAATGTGTPAVVQEDYVYGTTPETRL